MLSVFFIMHNCFRRGLFVYFPGFIGIILKRKVQIMLDLVQAYENYLTKVKHASSNTIASYMRDIRQFSQWLNESEGIDVIDASQLNIGDYMRHQEVQGRSGATISRCLASLKNFYLYLVSSGFLEKTPVTDIHVDIKHARI